MKKNEGFTLVEIIVAFALTMVIVLFLFQLIITIKKIYTNNFVASNLSLKQANISQMINNDLILSNLGNFTGYTTQNNCYNLMFQNSPYNPRKLCVDKSNNTITYNDYEFELVKGSKIGNVTIDKQLNNLYINIPISYPDLDKDYGIKAVLLNNLE